MGKTCEKCGKEMPDGSLAYEVKIQVYADFDGVLPEVGTADEMEARLRELAEVKILFPRQANAVFADLPAAARDAPAASSRFSASSSW